MDIINILPNPLRDEWLLRLRNFQRAIDEIESDLQEIPYNLELGMAAEALNNFNRLIQESLTKSLSDEMKKQQKVS